MYNAVQARVTQKVMISPAPGYRFGQLLRETRERLAKKQEDIGDALGVDRSLISQWERGVFKRPVAADDVNTLARETGVPVLQWVMALGYRIEFPGIESEEEVGLLDAYRQAPRDLQTAVRRVLGLPTRSILYPAPGSAALRRIADRPDRRQE